MHDDDRMIGNVVIDVKTEKKIKKKDQLLLLVKEQRDAKYADHTASSRQ
jgi:fructose-specific phosphotransferase system component IIB